MEDFLLELVPGLAEQWAGSPPDEVVQIERLAGRPLPPFYRWFLSRMGRSMGPLAYPQVDFSSQKVITSYAAELVVPHPRFLFIGHDSDEMMSLHFFYDLDLPTRTDSRVVRRHARGGERHEDFETFREFLAYGASFNFRLLKMPQRCRVLLKGDHPDIPSQLSSVLSRLGFTEPLTTGAFCGLYQRCDAVLIYNRVPREKPLPFMICTLGGADAGTLRRVLGTIATESSLKLEVREWEPPLT